MMKMKIVERGDVMTSQLEKELHGIVRRAMGLGSKKQVQLDYTGHGELICHYRKLKHIVNAGGFKDVVVARKKMSIFVYRDGKRPYTKPAAPQQPAEGAQS